MEVAKRCDRGADLDFGVDDDVADDVLAGRQLLRRLPPQRPQVQRQACAQAPADAASAGQHWVERQAGLGQPVRGV